MKIKVLSFLFLTFVYIAPYWGQVSKLDSHGNIKLLKNGALLVRLKTSDLIINGYSKQGKTKMAEEARLKQELDNKEIMAAFKQAYNFSSVYFFYSSHSDEIKNGKCKDLIFDVDSQPVAHLNCDNVLIGELDESSTTHIEAFIIKDKNFNQLNEPFPFLIKKNSLGVKSRTFEEIVEELNFKLNNFMAKNQ